MAEPIVLNNYSDDSNSKEYIINELMPRVFHDIPMNNLNIGMYSIISEYLSQGLEQQAFTASFFFNESFITKSVLPDSVYAEAAIFNIGYSFATPSAVFMLLELRLDDIYANATLNANTGLYEFILDKNTKFNLSNGNVYSLDYDIMLQFKSKETSSRKSAIPAWNVQYWNTNEQNSIAINKNPYINYRVTEKWLCLFINISEYEREVHTVVNNIAGGLPNDDTVITCNNHICGFDIKYIDGNGNEQWLDKDHVLPIHADVPDTTSPYVHYIMDNQQTIRFMWQYAGSRYFVPPTNTSYEITVYTCHGEAANFTSYNNMEQPSIISASNKYSNNGNILKAGWLYSGSVGGTNIGNMETVRRETIEAYNTANVISTDHDIDEWFKTFFFKKVLYPFFFKRRDDPWGRVWSGYLSLKDDDDYIFRTNTLQARIPYDVLYNNNDNTVSSNEIIIPPAWVWVYNGDNEDFGEGRYTVTPYLQEDGTTVEQADTMATIDAKFIFANPFGIRIQKQPFAIGYFNPWINENTTATRIKSIETNDVNNDTSDISYIYHATPIMINFQRTYKDNYYKITAFIDPTIPDGWIDGTPLVKYTQEKSSPPGFSSSMWLYFKEPLDMYSKSIPILPLTSDDGYIVFDPEKTYFCATKREKLDNGNWLLSGIYVMDQSSVTPKKIMLPITGGNIVGIYGSDLIWGNDSQYVEPIYASGDTKIELYHNRDIDGRTDLVKFDRITSQTYYEMRLDERSPQGIITKITTETAIQTELTKYDEDNLWRIGNPYDVVELNVYFSGQDNPVVYTISNAANVYCPYAFTLNENGIYETTDIGNTGGNGIILYADMKPAPESGAIEYYRIPFSKMTHNEPMFSIENTLLPVEENNMRVLLHAIVNGTETGMIEMQPVLVDQDGTYRFESRAYPMNQMVDVDNRINIASSDNGGGSWIPSTPGSLVSIDATDPEFKITILIRSEDPTRDSEISIGDTYTGFRIVDEYMIDPISLVQELKEMRSVVNFGDSSTPTPEEYTLYTKFDDFSKYHEGKPGLYEITKYAYNVINDIPNEITFDTLKTYAANAESTYSSYLDEFAKINDGTIPNGLLFIQTILTKLYNASSSDEIEWKITYDTLYSYDQVIESAFEQFNIHGGLNIQLVPFVEYSLMTSDRYASFVSAFTQVHKALEPVIMKRLEGNNYLDCKLIATYGLPHSYCADIDKDNTYAKYWPDLNVQVEFDVCLVNQALTTTTINELRTIIKSYFSRLTSIHTPVDIINMDSNIYISHIIQQMEAHDNVAWMRFKGWYTDEKGKTNSNYMDANTQAICRKWKKIEDFPKYFSHLENRIVSELEHYVPEMFILEDDNIVINIVTK